MTDTLAPMNPETLDRILTRVQKPARYIGGEWNSVVRDWDATDVRMAICYPDVYEVGMSNLGILMLYDEVNREPHYLMERFFAPGVDLAAELRRASLPYFSLETKHPLGAFDVLGFSYGAEMTYTNTLECLDVAGIPVLAAERTDAHPLVIGGGTCMVNPEPMSPFLDAVYVGEGEEAILELLAAYREMKLANGGARPPRADVLKRWAAIPGVYIPTYYHTAYREDGTVDHVQPTVPWAPKVVEKRTVAKLPPPLTRPVVPHLEAVHDRGGVEVMRGCTRGCRFCQAGYVYRPVRQRDADEVVNAVGEIMRNTGYEEISLLSLSTADYAHIREVVEKIADRYHGERTVISLPSLRIDAFSVDLADTLARAQLKRQGFTFAPEAGSERMRRVINKYVPEEVILEATAQTARRGWNKLKFYFMVGLPTEEMEDVQAIVDLVGKVAERYQQTCGKRPRIRVGVSTFIPKPHTPFQWVPQDQPDSLRKKQELLRRGLRKVGAEFSWVDPAEAAIEGLLSMGDRRVGEVIYRAWRKGCRFDAWGEHFLLDKWLEALAEVGLSLDFYVYRERPLDEALPWAHVSAGVTYPFLRKEHKKTLAMVDTPDCRKEPCQVCGFQTRDNRCSLKYNDLVAFVRARKAATEDAHKLAGAAVP